MALEPELLEILHAEGIKSDRVGKQDRIKGHMWEGFTHIPVTMGRDRLIPAAANWVFHHPVTITCSATSCSIPACVQAAADRLRRKKSNAKTKGKGKAPASKAPNAKTKGKGKAPASKAPNAKTKGKGKAPASKAPTGITKKSIRGSTSPKARSPVPADPISSSSSVSAATATATDEPLFRPCPWADNEDEEDDNQSDDDDKSMSDSMVSSEFAAFGASGAMETS
jgi:hypothetical protein